MHWIRGRSHTITGGEDELAERRGRRRGVGKTVFTMKKGGPSAEDTERKLKGKFAGRYEEGGMQSTEKALTRSKQY
jgi:hypothetical protein